MDLHVFSSAQEASLACADVFGHAIARKPELVLGLPTGRTPLGVYDELARRHERRAVDFGRVTTFNLDELLGIAPDEPASFRAYMQRHLFSRVNVAPERIHFLEGTTPNPAAECARYEEALADAGGIDLLLLGLGGNGHLAFNEPGERLEALCHRARLTHETRVANAAAFGDDPTRVPVAALTLGMRALLQARSVVLLAFGASKAQAVQAMVQGPLTTHCPASFLQLHPSTQVWLDGPAAALLRR